MDAGVFEAPVGGLRWFVWGCTVLWVGVWIVWFGMRGEHRPLGMSTVTYFFAGFMGEMFLSLHRAFRIRGEGEEGATPGFATDLEMSLATFSVLTTGAAFGAYYALLRGTTFGGGGLFHPDAMTGIALGLGALHGMLAMATPAKLFSRSSVLQAAALGDDRGAAGAGAGGDHAGVDGDGGGDGGAGVGEKE